MLHNYCQSPKGRTRLICLTQRALTITHEGISLPPQFGKPSQYRQKLGQTTALLPVLHFFQAFFRFRFWSLGWGARNVGSPWARSATACCDSGTWTGSPMSCALDTLYNRTLGSRCSLSQSQHWFTETGDHSLVLADSQ